MKNQIFEIGFDQSKGILTSLVLCKDPERANFIKAGRGLAEPHGVPWYRREDGGVMFIAHHFFGDHLRLMFWQHSGLHK